MFTDSHRPEVVVVIGQLSPRSKLCIRFFVESVSLVPMMLLQRRRILPHALYKVRHHLVNTVRLNCSCELRLEYELTLLTKLILTV